MVVSGGWIAAGEARCHRSSGRAYCIVGQRVQERCRWEVRCLMPAHCLAGALEHTDMDLDADDEDDTIHQLLADFTDMVIEGYTHDDWFQVRTME